tara:strand:+ start:545 stop:2062 length:1518 start_codon:yes stop_codon:yes gene_type:complete
MTRTITIKNLKHIKGLTFNIPDPGVHLLAGQNGSGKTSLLACLRRIGHSNAFAQHFAASNKSRALDNFEGTEIRYRLDKRSVVYAYGGERWVPRPRSRSKFLSEFGYPSVLYIGATADRITPRPEDFKVQKVAQVPIEIRDGANRILGTKKFDNLRRINLKAGSGNSAFVMQASSPPNAKYYSERNFSLGELCILKLVRDLMNCADKSLLLIDELELALHPKAQIELLKYLQEMSIQKELTVIFSTHSVSLLKHVPRENIIFLESAGGNVTAVSGCFPTYALGNIAYDEERAPDVVIYVEDEHALYVADELKALTLKEKFKNEISLSPTIHVIPIGPFDSVIRFLKRGSPLIAKRTRSVALLDADVKTETYNGWVNGKNYSKLAEFQKLESQIKYLPWTPEVGLIQYLSKNKANSETAIRKSTGDNSFSIPEDLFGGIPTAAGAAQRNACKSAVRKVVIHMNKQLNDMSEERSSRLIFRIFAIWYFENHREAVMKLFGPIVSAST